MLMGLVDNVHDHVPEESTYPYVTFGNTSRVDFSTVTTNGFEINQVLNIYSRNRGRKEVHLITEALYNLLHGQQLSITGYEHINMRFESGEIGLLNDGLTYQGIMRLRLTVCKQ